MFKKKTTTSPSKGSAPAKAPAKKGGKKPARKKRVVFNFEAPSDHKPAFVEMYFQTAADGLLMPRFAMTRVRGNWMNPEAKRFNMLEYDLPTAMAAYSRLSGRLFAPAPSNRLTPNTQFRVVLRVNTRKPSDTNGLEYNALSVLIKDVARRAKFKNKKTGKVVVKWKSFTKEDLADKNPDFRKIRSTRLILPGAFTNMQLPPSTRKVKGEDE